jgi:hypothetical protein
VSVIGRTSLATRSNARTLVGGAAIIFPLVYLVSDIVEVAQGDFSAFRLCLTYAGEAGFPLFVVGLAMLVQEWIPRWAALGALAYAYSFVFFTSTVIWALVAHTSSWEMLNKDFGWWMTVHGAVMVVGGITFGAGIVLTGVLPPWTGWALAVGVVLVASASGMGNAERTIAAAVPDMAFVGMGLALLRRPKGGTVELAREARLRATTA